MVGSVGWFGGRSLAACFARGRAYAAEDTSAALAFTHAERAVQLEPGNSHYHAGAGDLAVRLGKFERGIAHYRAAVDNDPFRASYHWRLARALMAARGINPEALAEFRRAVALNPTNPRYRRDLDDAEETVRQAPGDLLQSPPAKEE
jgi:tetratricopeptide (TPR) repeat protein